MGSTAADKQRRRNPEHDPSPKSPPSLSVSLYSGHRSSVIRSNQRPPNILQVDLSYMTMCFCYFVKRDLFSASCCTIVYTIVTFYSVQEQRCHVYLVGLYDCLGAFMYRNIFGLFLVYAIRPLSFRCEMHPNG